MLSKIHKSSFILIGILLIFYIIISLILPYQTWDYEQRISIYSGIYKLAQRESEWWFCLIIPFLVCYLLLQNSKEWKPLPLIFQWQGIPLILLSYLFYWAGYKVNTAYLGFFSLQLGFFAFTYTFMGWHWLKRLQIYLWILFFGWPLIALENRLSVPLRFIATELANSIMNLIGFKVTKVGTAIYSAADYKTGLAEGALFKLDVEEACSGIRSLFALLLMSLLYGHYYARHSLSKLALIASTFPLALLGNVFRLITLAYASLWFGSEFAIGRNLDGNQEMSSFHSLAGLSVFAICLIGLIFLCHYYDRWFKHFYIKKAPQSPPIFSAQNYPWGKAILIPCLYLGAVTYSYVTHNDKFTPDPLYIQPSQPDPYLNYQIHDYPMTNLEKSKLDEDVNIYRKVYQTRQADLTYAIVTSGLHKRSLHSPTVCLPNMGWSILSQFTHTISLTQSPYKIKANYIKFVKAMNTPFGLTHHYAYNIYFYIGSHQETAATYEDHVTKTYIDGLIYNINHRWSLISYFMEIKPESNNFLLPPSDEFQFKTIEKFILDTLPSTFITPNNPNKI
jgi:exosortase